MWLCGCSFEQTLIFKIGNWRYVVFKYGNKTDKGRVTSKIEFYRINKENIKEILRIVSKYSLIIYFT